MARLVSGGRRGALYLLNGVIADKRLISEIMEDSFFLDLRTQERATAQRLCMETLRLLPQIDAHLDTHLSKRPTGNVMQILRLGSNELIRGGDAHGVVNDWVNMAKSNHRYRHSSGLVNAVLRKVSKQEAPSAPMGSPLPQWLHRPLVKYFKKEAVMAMEGVFAQAPPLDLTIKNGDGQAWAKELGGEVTAFGSVRLTSPGQVSQLAGYKDGDWWVQDTAASLPAQMITAPQGARVLDLCAAPGGKTMQLAAAGFAVTALDKSKSRAAKIRENLKRTGLSAQVLVQDGLKHQGKYDAVLLDAPCSATGTLRRHPELPYVKTMEQFEPLFALQAELLDHAATLVAPGGELVFCTCSLLPQEGERQIEKFLLGKPNFKLSASQFDRLDIDQAWRTPEGGLRLRPDFWAETGGMDGFYIAVLQKIS